MLTVAPTIIRSKATNWLVWQSVNIAGCGAAAVTSEEGRGSVGQKERARKGKTDQKGECACLESNLTMS